MSLAGSSHGRKDGLYSGLEYRNQKEDDTDDGEDNASLNRKTTTLQVILHTQTFPTVKIPTSLPQTFPSVTIPTALTSPRSFTTVTLGPTSVLISFSITSTSAPFSTTISTVPLQSTIPFISVASTSINFFSTSASIPVILSTFSTRPTTTITEAPTPSTASTQSLQNSSTSIGSLKSTSTAAVAVNGSSTTFKLKLSPGAIAGVTITGLVVFLVFALLLFFLWTQLRSRKRASSGRSDSLYEKQLVSPISLPYDRRGTVFTPENVQRAQRPAYPSDRASSEIFQINAARNF